MIREEKNGTFLLDNKKWEKMDINMENGRYQTYIFDLYGTLVDIHTEEDAPEVWEKLALFYGYYDAIYEPEELRKEFRRLIGQKENAMREEMRTEGGKAADTHEAFPEIEIENVFRELFENKGIMADETLAVHAGQFFRVLSTEYIHLYEGAKELLAALKQAGGRLYLLSNAQRIFTEYEMHTLGIASYFEDIFISSSCGVKKPDERFFRMLLEKHDIDVSKAVMIGNDMNSDIRGAKQVGLSTFYIHSNISPELDGEIEADDVLLEMDMRAVKQKLLG